jgi:UDP-N-acetylglucosamine 4,6-dehydratase/5-epimerase
MLDGNVLITGGTGSLGSAILERAAAEKWPARFTVIARNETKLSETRRRFNGVNTIVGDIRDANWLKTIFPGHDTVIHAAAIKIVPVAESNPREAYLTNVAGSEYVAQAAITSGVKTVVGISTDKVCGPTYYGNTKRLMEGIFREACSWGDTSFVLCRYGNVLRSNNSIVPLFESQIQANKPFTITDINMTRFWLSMRQAVDLVLYTYNNAERGQIFVPKAPSMSIVDLARTLDPDRQVVEIGIRPGERVHETLIVREEALHSRDNGNHFTIYPPSSKVESNLPYQYEYTSDKPAHWLTSEELRVMLAES